MQKVKMEYILIAPALWHALEPTIKKGSQGYFFIKTLKQMDEIDKKKPKAP